jgi:integrase
MAGCRPLNNEEIEKIKPLLNQRDRTLFILGIKTGYRISELLSLKIKDVLKHGEIVDTLRIERNFVKGKEKAQEIPLHNDAKAEIKALLDTLTLPFNLDEYLFKSKKGENKAISRVQAHCILKDAINTLCIQGKVSWHSTKKTFAHRFYEKSGYDLRKTQIALRHKYIDTTIKYIEPDKKEVDDYILDL